MKKYTGFSKTMKRLARQGRVMVVHTNKPFQACLGMDTKDYDVFGKPWWGFAPGKKEHGAYLLIPAPADCGCDLCRGVGHAKQPWIEGFKWQR